MLQIQILRGTELQKAVSVISSMSETAVVLIDGEAERLLILARDHEGEDQGQLIAALRLNNCFHYEFHDDSHEFLRYLDINLARLRGILNEANQVEDEVHISLDGAGTKMNFIIRNSFDKDTRRELEVIPIEAPVFPADDPLVNVDINSYKVTAKIRPVLFLLVLKQIRSVGESGDGYPIDKFAPVNIKITSNKLVFESSEGVETLEQERGAFEIEGTEENDEFALMFLPFVHLKLKLFFKTLCIEDQSRVSIYAQHGLKPVLNCPFGTSALGNLFFIGNEIDS